MRERAIIFPGLMFPRTRVREQKAVQEEAPKATDLSDFYFSPMDFGNSLGKVLVDEDRQCAMMQPWQWRIFQHDPASKDQDSYRFEERADGNVLVFFC
jgi:hypothetical protein